MRPHRLEMLFNPQSIAVLGANDDLESVGGRVFHNLTSGDFGGTVIPVNPKHESVAGQRCYASLGEIEQTIDLAVIAVPGRAAIDIIADCGEQRIGAAVVLSAGFGETGEGGKRLEAKLADAARRANVRFVGPNCLGVMRPVNGLNATFLSGGAPRGKLALVSQSGALCAAIVDWATPHHLGFSTLVSLGNAIDVDFGDILDYLATDPESDAILLYVEGVNDARAFMSGLRVAARSKPVIVLKAGRHGRGSRAATTHTGALVGSDDVFDAALERAGVVRAMTFGQLFAAAEILSTNKRVSGNALAIVTNGGGAGVLATDRAEDLGVAIPELSVSTFSALDDALPAYWSHGNPVDILGDAGPQSYATAVNACLADDKVDGLLAMLTPQAMTQPDDAAQALIEAASAEKSKPVLACFMGEVRVAAARQALSSKGIPDFTTPEKAVEAFSYLARHHRNQKLLLQVPGPISDNSRPPDVDGARMIVEAALADGRTMLSDRESKAVLSAFRIKCSQTIEATSSSEALVAAESLGFPVAMKISSPDISHKSDVDGVRTGLINGQDVREAYDQLVNRVKQARPDFDIRGVTIEPMVSGSDNRELMVGVKRDEVFGPVISFGAGGTMAEILRDNAVTIPPLNRVLAARVIDRTRVAKLLGPFRQMAAVDRQAVEDVLLRLSDMVCELPHIEELDINPLFAGAQEVIAVDARIRVQRPEASPRPYAHMAIHPYPPHLTSKTYLSDGAELTIRAIRPEDAELEQAFIRGLSAESKYYRFMQTLEELTPEMLVRFTQIDYSREMAVVAMVGDNGSPKQVGVARYVTNPDGETCEFAIVVSDELRNQGIGSALMKALMTAAREVGLRSMEGEILADNTRMLTLMKSIGFSLRSAPYDPGLKIAECWL